ncbi:hypothetical protein LUR56_00395 [Streptomyces sp. MT29]|nr:hypothetical protein [Streptomyces sp. MT29]
MSARISRLTGSRRRRASSSISAPEMRLAVLVAVSVGVSEVGAKPDVSSAAR